MGAGWSGDVIQSHDGSRLAQWEQKLLLLPPWLRPLKRRLIGWLPRYREFRALMARQYGDPRRLVIAVSKRVAGDYQRYHGVRPSQIRVVYHGVDTERFSPERCAVHRASTRRALGFSEEETVLLLAAHNFALKGLATMIRALGRLRGEGSPLAGGGRRRRPARTLHPAGPALRRRPRRPVRGPVDDPLPYYAAADVYVQPTFYDSFGLTVLEAAACGLPVVTTQFAGVSELIERRHGGLRAPRSGRRRGPGRAAAEVVGSGGPAGHGQRRPTARRTAHLRPQLPTDRRLVPGDRRAAQATA